MYPNVVQWTLARKSHIGIFMALLTVNLPDELHEALKAKAKADDTSMSRMVRKLLRDAVGAPTVEVEAPVPVPEKPKVLIGSTF